MPYDVSVIGLEFYGYHGVSDAERSLGNRFRADLDAVVDGAADVTDELSDTVDYAALAALVVAVSGGQNFRTVERLAGAACEAALERFPALLEIEVEIAKLNPPMPLAVAEASATVRRARS